MRFYIVRPEVPGGLGDNTEMDHGGDRVAVSHLHYEFDGWYGDELITSHPAFAATTTLADAFARAGLTGFRTRAMEATRSDTFDELYPGRELPPFTELVIDGTAGVDDLAIDGDDELVLSQRALDIVNATGPLDTEVVPLDGHGRPAAAT